MNVGGNASFSAMNDGPALDAQAYDQRLDAIAAAFHGRYGEVSYGDTVSPSGGSRKLQINVAVPGWGFPLVATMVFVEKHVRTQQQWVLYEYAYDLHLEPKPKGRYAFHWARGVFHVHCEDPAGPRPDRHYKGAPIDDVFWVAELLSTLIHRGISCFGLQPLAAWQEHL